MPISSVGPDKAGETGPSLGPGGCSVERVSPPHPKTQVDADTRDDRHPTRGVMTVGRGGPGRTRMVVGSLSSARRGGDPARLPQPAGGCATPGVRPR